LKPLRPRFVVASLAAILIVAGGPAAVVAAADAEPSLEPADAFPAALPEPLRAVLVQPGHRVTQDGKVLAELWLRQGPAPTGGANEGALSV
jgi:hypothetical protein